MQNQLTSTQRIIMIIGLILISAVVAYCLIHGQVSNLNNTYLN